MATRKREITVKTDKTRRGTISRATIKRVVKAVFEAARAEKSSESARTTPKKRKSRSKAL